MPTQDTTRKFRSCRHCTTVARNFVNQRQGYRRVKDGAARSVNAAVSYSIGLRGPNAARILLIRNFDPRISRPLPLDQSEQCRRMRRVQPDASMRRRTAKPRQIVGAVNRKAVVEDRMRHGRVVIFPREVMPRHRLWVEYPARRAKAASAGRNRPAISRRTVDANSHALGRLVDLHHDIGGSRRRQCQSGYHGERPNLRLSEPPARQPSHDCAPIAPFCGGMMRFQPSVVKTGTVGGGGPS